MPKIKKTKNILNNWLQRDLTLFGRVLLSKAEGLSRFVYPALSLSDKTSKVINKTFLDFIWKNKPCKLKKDIISGKKIDGGLEMLDFFFFYINNNPRNPKQLFKTVNYLLSPPALTHKNNTDDQCNKFLDFFTTKITTIHANLIPSNVIPSITPISAPILSHFTTPTHRQVETLIHSMRPSMCSLDPFPTAMIKSNTISLSPLITTIINSSLQSGHFPILLKTALINPRLKKPSLDPDILANYLPVSNLPFLFKVLEKVVIIFTHIVSMKNFSLVSAPAIV